MRSEVIAVLASGTSFNRFLLPYIVGGTILATILFFGMRYWVPKANVIQSDFKKTYLDKNDPLKNRSDGSCFNCFYKRIDSNTFIGIKNYNAESHISGVFFMDRVSNGKLVYNLRAQSLKWDTTNKKRNWVAEQVVERFVDSLGERIVKTPSKVVMLNMAPDELIKDEYLKDKLSTPQLSVFIKREELRGTEGLNALKVEKYRRTATAFTVVLLTFIGAVIASRKTRGGSGMHLALGIIIAAVFIIADRFSTVFSTKGSFPPLLAAWVPNIVFSIVAWRLYLKAPK